MEMQRYIIVNRLFYAPYFSNEYILYYIWLELILSQFLHIGLPILTSRHQMRQPGQWPGGR